MHEGCRETFGKRKNTRAAGEQHPKWITLYCLENHLVIFFSVLVLCTQVNNMFAMLL